MLAQGFNKNFITEDKEKITMTNGAISSAFSDLTIGVRRIFLNCVNCAKSVKNGQKWHHPKNAQKQRFVKKHFFPEKVKKRPPNSPPSNKN